MCLWKNFEIIGDFYLLVIAIKKTDSQKLPGVIIDQKLNFEEHKKTICQMTGKKLNALTRLSYLIAPYQLKLILKPFINSFMTQAVII